MFLLTSSIFLLTIKFQIIGNILVAALSAVFFSKIKIKPIVFFLIWMISCVLLGWYFFSENLALLKYSFYLIRFLVLAYLIVFIVNSNINLSRALEIIFFVHVITILLCSIFPFLNDFFRAYFSYNSGSEQRITGFIAGYEFVPFIVTTYLIYDYLNGSKQIDLKFLMKLVLGVVTSLLSGRYSVIPVGILLIYILRDPSYFVTKITFLLAALASFAFFYGEMALNTAQTALMLLDYAQFGAEHDFSAYSSDASEGMSIDGQYNLSPLTLINEIIFPFTSWSDYLLPSAVEMALDPGPSYMTANIGSLLTLVLYVFFFKSVRSIFGASLPGIVIVIFLVIDFKFRSLYVLMPMVWLLLNHANHVNYLNSIKRLNKPYEATLLHD